MHFKQSKGALQTWNDINGGIYEYAAHTIYFRNGDH